MVMMVCMPTMQIFAFLVLVITYMHSVFEKTLVAVSSINTTAVADRKGSFWLQGKEQSGPSAFHKYLK